MDEPGCGFIGCRPTRFRFKYKENHSLCKKIKAALREQAALFYGQGVRTFYIGADLGVPIWAGEEILRLKAAPAYPGIRLICAIPFPGFDSRWDSVSRSRCAKLLASCDETPCIRSDDDPAAYRQRDYFVVDRSRYLVAVWDNDRSQRSPVGIAVNYAKSKRREIRLIHPDTGVLTAPEQLSFLCLNRIP